MFRRRPACDQLVAKSAGRGEARQGAGEETSASDRSGASAGRVRLRRRRNSTRTGHRRTATTARTIATTTPHSAPSTVISAGTDVRERWVAYRLRDGDGNQARPGFLHAPFLDGIRNDVRGHGLKVMLSLKTLRLSVSTGASGDAPPYVHADAACEATIRPTVCCAGDRARPAAAWPDSVRLRPVAGWFRHAAVELSC